MERIAILPVEGLSARDGGLDWASAAASGLASRALTGAPGVVAIAALDRAAAIKRQATRIVHAYAVREGSGWRVRGTIEDAPTHRTIAELDVAAANPAEFGPAIASAIWSGAPKSAWNPEAVQAYGKAIRTPAREAVPLLRDAVKLEPKFEDAWLLLAQMESAVSGPAAAAAVIAAAPQTAAVKLVASSLRGDASGQLDALRQAALSSPSSWEGWAQLASAAVQARAFAEGAAAFTKALELEPRSADLLNRAAYAYQLAGDHSKAMASIAAYEKLAPNSANPIDSRGEILTMAGKFEEAAKAFRDAEAKEPNFLGGILLLKAAEAKRLGGDQAGAGRIFEEWERAHSNHPLAWMHRAQWDYTSGRKAQAEARLRQQGGAPAFVQLVVWKLEQGDRKGAEEALAHAAAVAGPANQNAVKLGRGMLTGEIDAPALRGVSLLLRREFAAATPLLEQAVKSERPDQASPAPVLLAWAYVETGQIEKAKPLLAVWPIPRSGSDLFFECLVFPRILELRKRAGLG